MFQIRKALVGILAVLFMLPAAAQSGEWLLRDANVVTMTGAPPIASQDILIRDGRIAAIEDTGRLTTKGRVVEVNGAWVIPGLHDMHVHLGTEQMLAMYVANGVTSIRVMNGNQSLLELVSGVADGGIFGPNIFLASPLLEGQPPLWPQSEPVTTPEQARQLVERYASEGYRAIKIYDGLTAPVLAATAEEAKRHSLPVVGHMPDAIELEQLLVHDPASLEHVGGYLPGWFSGGRQACDIPEWQLTRLAGRLAEAGVTVVPTLSLFHQSSNADSRELTRAQPEFNALPPGITGQFWLGATPEPGSERARAANCKSRNAERFTRALIAAGGSILPGTDSPNPWLVPGRALHLELERLVAAGMPPEQALAAATVDAAAWFGDKDRRGTIETGQPADLVVLEANPLEDIRHVGAVTGVVIRGQWQSQASLRQRWQPAAGSETGL
jgi:cytosine/adenosine deaminase-related metal-dependent hydrolase